MCSQLVTVASQLVHVSDLIRINTESLQMLLDTHSRTFGMVTDVCGIISGPNPVLQVVASEYNEFDQEADEDIKYYFFY